MSRPLRIEYSGAWYHVMNRGRRGEDIFANSEDFQTFLKLLREGAELWHVKVGAYCLMSNHYHLLVQTPHGNLSRFMRHLNGIYTQRYNRSHRCDGQLFRGRYKAILVEEERYLLELVRYIHRNPLRAEMVKDIDHYAWSSHPGYLSAGKQGDWFHKEFLLTMLATDTRKRDKAYQEFIQQEDSEAICQVFDKKKLPSILGPDEFINRVKNRFYAEKTHNQVPEAGQLAPTMSRIIEAVCQYYGGDIVDLVQSRRGVKNEPRSVAIYLARALRRDSLLTISSEFGMQSYSPASSAIERVIKRLSTDQGFRQRVEKIKLDIAGEKCQTET